MDFSKIPELSSEMWWLEFELNYIYVKILLQRSIFEFS